MTLRNKRIVIVGGSSGIGLATAQSALAAGAHVIIVSSRQTSIDRALAELNGPVTGHTIDVLDKKTVTAFFDDLGEIDHLVYTAGEPLTLNPIIGMDISAAQDFFQVRYFGALTTISAAAPHLHPEGSITLTSGSARTRPGAGWSLGASISGAVTSLTKALAIELAPIRVNCVEPGIIRSPLWDAMTETDRHQMYEQQGATLPAGRIGEVTDVAQAFIYAMTQTFTTGMSIPVDGGALLV
jgi:NAD(P)-dependent dehydrogenase (short-subunit alcohol dehydrogenase family)